MRYSVLILGALGLLSTIFNNNEVPQQQTTYHRVLANNVPMNERAITGNRNLLRKLSTHTGMGDLRLAVFGGANSYGVGLGNRFDAYPYLLSQTVDNYAHASAGPNYYSVCTETVVGDDAMYDVIIMDYWLRYYEGLEELARRLRQRYPHAIILFIRNWLPIHFKRKINETSTEKPQSIEQWKIATGISDATKINEVIQKIREDDGYWYFPSHATADDALRNITKDVGGIEFSFHHIEGDPKKTLLNYLGLFEHHRHAHISELGHKALADALYNQIEASLKSKHETLSQQISTGVHGHWGNGDECKLWYNSGGADIEFSEQLQLREFDEHNGWFALEVNGTGWFEIENRLHDADFETRTLYISFMTSDDADEYPPTQLTIGDNQDHKVVLDPYNTVDKHHNIRTLHVGQVRQGDLAKIHLAPLHDHARSPFRVVGVAFTNEIAQPMEYGFGPTHG